MFYHLSSPRFPPGNSGINGQGQMCRIAIQNLDLSEINRFVFEFVYAPIGSAGTYLHLFGKHAVLNHDIAVRTQNNLFFQFLRLLFLLFLYSGSRVTVFLVDFLQVFVLIIQRKQIQVGLQVKLALVLNRITQLDIVTNRCPAFPVIGCLIARGSIGPIQDGNVLHRKLPNGRKRLVIIFRCPEIGNAFHYGVFPKIIIIRIQFLVHLHMWFLDTGIRPGRKSDIQVVCKCPIQAESPVPIKLLAERDRQGSGRAITRQLPQLTFIIIACHHGLKIDRRSQIER